MILVLFLFNAPLNDAVIQWTPQTLSVDWSRYWLQWETGHTIATLLTLAAFEAMRATSARATRMTVTFSAARSSYEVVAAKLVFSRGKIGGLR